MTTETTLRQMANSYAAGLLPDQCVLWPHGRSGNGYGQVWTGDRVEYAHRAVLKLTAGEPPADTPHALHSCDVRACFNPSHLRWGSVADNTADMIDRGRHSTVGRKGEDNAQAKLTDAQVAEIRAIYVKGQRPYQREIAERYGIHQVYVSQIIRGVYR